MRKEPTLVIITSDEDPNLYQLAPIGKNNETLTDYALYDAYKAGFKKAIIITDSKSARTLRHIVNKRAGAYIQLTILKQNKKNIPHPYELPKGREKAWGSVHQLLAAKKYINGPFAVIESNTLYGPDAFSEMYYQLNHLEDKFADKDEYNCCMLGYDIINTLSDNRYVKRNICKINDYGLLEQIDKSQEVFYSEKDKKIIAISKKSKENYKFLENSKASMNFWGFTDDIFREIEKQIPVFLNENIKINPFESELNFTDLINNLVKNNKAKVKVYPTISKYYGITTEDDKKDIKKIIKELTYERIYPETLWKKID